jgi:hypothetical protein
MHSRDVTVKKAPSGPQCVLVAGMRERMLMSRFLRARCLGRESGPLFAKGRSRIGEILGRGKPW